MALFPEVVDPACPFIPLSPVLALAVNVLGQIVLLRSSRGSHFLRSIVGGFLAGLIALGLLDLVAIRIYGLSHDTLMLAFVVNTLTYGALSYCYFNFVNLGQSSIRIRLYAEIAASGQGVSIAEMAREYNEEALMKMRLQRLRESGDIVEKDGRYFVGRSRLVFIGHVIFGAKRFILGKDSEFHVSA